MYEEFEELINNINSIDDAMFETLNEQTIEKFRDIFNYDELERYSKNAFIQMKEMHYSPEEYQREVNLARQGIQDLLAMVNNQSNSENKKKFLNRMVESMAAAIETAIADNDYYDVRIQVQRIDENAHLPHYAHPWDAGADIYANENMTIAPGQTVIVPTGLKFNIPKGWILSIRPRSGMSAKTGIRVSNAPGTIDTGYLSEVGVILTNTGDEDYYISIGDRIAQFVVERRWNALFEEVDDINAVADTNRAGNSGDGYGSTGK